MNEPRLQKTSQFRWRSQKWGAFTKIKPLESITVREAWHEMKELPCLRFAKPGRFAWGCSALPKPDKSACSLPTPPGRAQIPARLSGTLGKWGKTTWAAPLQAMFSCWRRGLWGHEHPDSQRSWHTFPPRGFTKLSSRVLFSLRILLLSWDHVSDLFF